MPQSHQLAAVLFADIVGYTAIMQKDENQALEKISRFKNIVESFAGSFDGKIIQYYGDGCLVLFNSSIDAVSFAIAMQQDFEREPTVPARVGIHMGDVLLKDGNAFGDAINIASRIQALAQPGGICISETVQKNIANKKNVETEFVKTETLKNVKDPVRIYRVRSPSIYSRNRKMTSKNRIMLSISGLLLLIVSYFIYNGFLIKAHEPKNNITHAVTTSIAVLPFKDNSPGKDQEYLGDGIAEEILNELTQIKGVKVKGRASSFRFKGRENELQNISKMLGAEIILTGSVQKLGSIIRIYVQLINAKEDDVIWSEQYDRELKDIFSLQDQIAAEISEKLKATLLASPGITRNVSPEAYESVLKGNFFFNKGDFQKAIENYNLAISLDPGYAYPYVRLGWTYYQLTLFKQFPSREGFEKATGFLRKGLSLQLSYTEKKSAHHALAYINLWQFNWSRGLAEYNRSKEGDTSPGSFQAFYEAMVLGNTTQAVQLMEKVAQENPFDMLTLRDLSIIQYLDGQFQRAMETSNEIIELDSSFSESYRLKGTIYYVQKKYDLAMYELEKAENLGNPWAKAISIMTMIQAAQRPQARKQYEANKDKLGSLEKGLIHYAFGEAATAFDWLDKSYEEQEFWLVSLKTDTIWSPLRADRRFVRVLREMNFP